MSKSPSILSAVLKLRPLLEKRDKITCALIAGISIFSSAFEIGTASIIVIFAQTLTKTNIGEKYLSKIGLGGEYSDNRVIFYMACLFGAVFLIKSVMAAIEGFYQNFKIQKMNQTFKSRLLWRYASMGYDVFLTRNASYGLSVLGGDVERVFSGGMVALATIFSELIVFMCLVGLVVYVNPSLFFVVASVGVLGSLFCIKVLLPLFFKWGKSLQDATFLGSKNLLQFFHGFKEITLSGKSGKFIERYMIFSKRTARAQAIQFSVNALPRVFIEMVFAIFFVGAVTFLCFTHEAPGEMMGILGGYLYIGFRLMPGVNRIISQLNTFKAIIPNIERVHKEWLAFSEGESLEDISNFNFEDSIKFKNVSFKYLGADKKVLENINIEIKKGEKIGIVGETGSGKSTFVDLILGLLKPEAGEVRVDESFPAHCSQWHQRIGYVPQAVYLADDTIESNIAFGEDEKSVNLEKIENAIDVAQLRNLVERLPNGVKTVVGERGVRLSGGERQRIAIARALYREPEVLIFDEATSALDSETEEKLMKTINEVSKNRTVIMIAHRLSTLKGCDRVFRVEGGQVFEEGRKASKDLRKVGP